MILDGVIRSKVNTLPSFARLDVHIDCTLPVVADKVDDIDTTTLAKKQPKAKKKKKEKSTWRLDFERDRFDATKLDEYVASLIADIRRTGRKSMSQRESVDAWMDGLAAVMNEAYRTGDGTASGADSTALHRLRRLVTPFTEGRLQMDHATLHSVVMCATLNCLHLTGLMHSLNDTVSAGIMAEDEEVTPELHRWRLLCQLTSVLAGSDSGSDVMYELSALAPIHLLIDSLIPDESKSPTGTGSRVWTARAFRCHRSRAYLKKQLKLNVAELVVTLRSGVRTILEEHSTSDSDLTQSRNPVQFEMSGMAPCEKHKRKGKTVVVSPASPEMLVELTLSGCAHTSTVKRKMAPFMTRLNFVYCVPFDESTGGPMLPRGSSGMDERVPMMIGSVERSDSANGTLVVRLSKCAPLFCEMDPTVLVDMRWLAAMGCASVVSDAIRRTLLIGTKTEQTAQ